MPVSAIDANINEEHTGNENNEEKIELLSQFDVSPATHGYYMGPRMMVSLVTVEKEDESKEPEDENLSQLTETIEIQEGSKGETVGEVLANIDTTSQNEIGGVEEPEQHINPILVEEQIGEE